MTPMLKQEELIYRYYIITLVLFITTAVQNKTELVICNIYFPFHLIFPRINYEYKSKAVPLHAMEAIGGEEV
jgi:hypothetical protein